MSITPTLLQRIGMQRPIIQAPMTGSDTPALAAAVSRAGGLGSLGCGARSPVAMREAAAAVRAATDQPFAMNLFVLDTPSPDAAEVRAALERLAPLYERLQVPLQAPSAWCQDFAAQFETLLELRPAVASFTFGLLTPEQVRHLHRVGSLVVGTATTVAEALAWQNVGADAVVASGVEGGGHRGTFLSDWESSQIGTMALVPACVDALEIPVIAAGGIMDGQGIRAALALGAVAAQLGTAFIACAESSADAAYRAALTSPAAHHTAMTRAISGRPARCLANRFTAWGAEAALQPPAYPIAYDAGKALNAAAKAKGEGGFGAQWAGQGAPLARALPAAELISLLAREMQESA